MPTKEEREAWKQQLIDNAEQKIVELTDTDKGTVPCQGNT